MPDTLKPCPHCGEADELYPAHHGMGGGEPYAIDCLGCGADFTPREGKDVIAAWNRRTPDPEQQAATIERMRAATVAFARQGFEYGWKYAEVGSRMIAGENGPVDAADALELSVRAALEPTHD